MQSVIFADQPALSAVAMSWNGAVTRRTVARSAFTVDAGTSRTAFARSSRVAGFFVAVGWLPHPPSRTIPARSCAVRLMMTPRGVGYRYLREACSEAISGSLYAELAED